MKISDAIRNGITRLSHPTWTRGHIHVTKGKDGRIMVRGHGNDDISGSWVEPSDDYLRYDNYEPYYDTD